MTHSVPARRGSELVEVLLDGKPVAKAENGLSSPGTAVYWKISTDPQHPDVGFHAHVEAGDLAPGRHWLGLRLYGRDGSVERSEEHTSELQSLMRISYAVLCLKKKKTDMNNEN